MKAKKSQQTHKQAHVQANKKIKIKQTKWNKQTHKVIKTKQTK